MNDKKFDELTKMASADIPDEPLQTNRNVEGFIPDRRHKIKMNRLFRERVGGTFLPYPEVDNIFEKIRSHIVIKLQLHR